jgi:hypothetical protein
MQSRSAVWWAPLAGAVAVVLVIVGVIVAGEGPDATKDSAREVVDFYSDNKDSQMIGGFLFSLAALFLLFYGGSLRKVLRAGEGAGGTLSAVAFGGVVVFSVAAVTNSTLTLAAADLADDIDPVAVQAINGLIWEYFLPFAVGMAALLIASGLSVIRHETLPRWLGWVALVLGIASATPAGFFAAIGGGLWIRVTSLLMARSAREAS